MHDFKIFGERNTSTNALRQIVESNSLSRCCPSTSKELDPDLAGRLRRLPRRSRATVEAEIDRVFARYTDRESWKHCATSFENAAPFSGLQIFFLVRHPASWLLSLFKNPYHILGKRPDDLAGFLEYQWKTVGRERLGQATFTPLSLYQTKLRSYLAFCSALNEVEARYTFLRFEDLILSQRETFERIAPSLRQPAENFRELQDSTKSVRKSLDHYKAYYGEELWRAELSGLENRLNASVDWELFADFGYERL
jgi:hypothetical protein